MASNPGYYRIQGNQHSTLENANYDAVCGVANDRPTLKDFHHIGVVRLVSAACATRSTVWKELGYELSLDESNLDVIEVNNRHDIGRCCSAMFTLWLEKQPSASWEKLKEALVAVELGKLVNMINEKLSLVPVQKYIGITDGSITDSSKLP